MRHLTASVAAFDPWNRILLVHHNLYGCWVLPGGHVEDGESPDEAAIREVLEETGLEVEIRSATDAVGQDISALQLPVPLVIAEIPHPGKPARGEGPHVHVDMLYAALITGGEMRGRDDENSDVRAVALPDLPALGVREDVGHAAWLAAAFLMGR